MTIGDKIKNLRVSQNLTQEELAQAVKTKKQTIHKYETGIISNIPASKIKLIADCLHTTPAYLMGWEEGEGKSDVDRSFSELTESLSEQEKGLFVDFLSSETNREFFKLLLSMSDSDKEWLKLLIETKIESRN